MTPVRVLRHLVLVTTTALLMSGCLMISQSDADSEAGVFADALLAPRLERELEGVQGGSAQSRVQAIHAWLTAPDVDFLRITHGAVWSVGAPEGSTIPVVVYELWVDKAFVNDSKWGRVCREYDVGATVTSRDVTCPAGTPVEPPWDVSGGRPQ
ncbi:hypothetical protein JT358_02935 [Micrococcales bacterium 31B]|nr:hypothetical protein [Micrococcales bacterium 31B]